MKKILFLLLTFITTLSFAQSDIRTMQWQGVDRVYKVTLPANYSGEESLPMFVFLHGLRDNIDNYTELFQRVADEFNWIVVRPQALETSVDFMGSIIDLGTMWNAGISVNFGTLTISPNQDVDDRGFILATIDATIEELNVDTNKVFLSGFSMGGFMTHRMAIENDGKIKAFAASSGMIPKSLENTTPLQDTKMMHIHGTEDVVVEYGGATSIVQGMPNLIVGMSVEATVNYWVNHNGLNNTPIVDYLEDRKDDGLTFVRYSYLGDEANKEVRFLKINGGEHIPYTDTAQYDVDCLVEIYDFLSNERISVGLDEVQENIVRVFPNPATDCVNLIVDKPMTVQILSMQGVEVKSIDLKKGVNRVDVSSLPKGIYFLKNKFGERRKLIIM